MSYVILGQTIKNEYLSLGTLVGTGLIAWAASRGGSKSQPASSGKTIIEKVKEAVPINAGSSEEEQFIRSFIAEAEKEGGGKH